MSVKIEIQRVDPWSLTARGVWSSAIAGGSVSWDSSSEMRLDGSIPFSGSLPGTGDMLRVVREEEDGRRQPVATGFWTFDGSLDDQSTTSGEVSLLSPLVALEGALTTGAYVIAQGARAQQVISDCCQKAWRPLLVDTTLSDARYMAPVVYEAGTSLLKIAQDAAATAGLELSVDAWGHVILVDRTATAAWSWSDLGDIIGKPRRSSTFWTSPTGVVATWEGEDDASLSATAYRGTLAQGLGRRIETHIDAPSALGASYPALLGVASRTLDEMSVDEVWEIVVPWTTASIFEAAHVQLTSGGVEMRGVIQHVDVPLDAIMSCTLQIAGEVM